MKKQITCPHCGKSFSVYANPTPTTDVLIYDQNNGIVIISRKNEPHGFALPGGFIDERETAEHAAIREMKEETGLDVRLIGLLGTYSHPDRDPRMHTISIVFVGEALDPGQLKAGDDAGAAAFYPLDALPKPFAFDHQKIINNFLDYLHGKRCLAPIEE